MQVKLPKAFEPNLFVPLERLGSSADGGYVIPSNVFRCKNITLVTIGVGFEISFELDVVKRFGDNIARIYLYDGTIDKYSFPKVVIKSLFLARFTKAIEYLFRWRDFNKLLTFSNVEFIQSSVYDHQCFDFIGIGDVLDPSNVGSSNLVVKIDCEGCEYRFLDEIIERKGDIDCLVIEFHDVDLHMPRIIDFIDVLGFSIVAVNANNSAPVSVDGIPSVVELVFFSNSDEADVSSGCVWRDFIGLSDPALPAYSIQFF